MDLHGQQFTIEEGTDVYGSDGDKVGSVVAVQPNYIVVEKGFFFPTDYYIPTGSVASYDDGKVYLNVTKDQALNQGWDTEPTDEVYETTTTTGYATDMGGTTVAATEVDTTYGTTAVAPDAGMGLGTTDTSVDVDTTTTRSGAMGTGQVMEGDRLSVPVHEEELTAVKRERDMGQVRIEKDVVSEERTLEVPVTEERVTVQRRVVDRAMDAGDATAFQEGTIEVPIRGEEVELQKRTVVSEEIEIGKEAVQRTEQVSGTVRREEVRVTEDVVGGGSTGGGSSTGSGSGGGIIDRAVDAVQDKTGGRGNRSS